MYWCYISEQPYQYQIHAKRGGGGQLKSQKRTLRVTFYQATLPTKSLLCLFHICTVTQLTNTIAKSDKSIPVYHAINLQLPLSNTQLTQMNPCHETDATP